MVIKTKPIYTKAEESDGVRILITRYYPRGIKKSHFDLWFRDLSPSPELLSMYKHSICDWGEFKELLIKEITTNQKAIEYIRILKAISKDIDITLLCYEREGKNCHRHIIKKLIEADI